MEPCDSGVSVRTGTHKVSQHLHSPLAGPTQDYSLPPGVSLEPELPPTALGCFRGGLQQVGFIHLLSHQWLRSLPSVRRSGSAHRSFQSLHGVRKRCWWSGTPVWDQNIGQIWSSRLPAPEPQGGTEQPEVVLWRHPVAIVDNCRSRATTCVASSLSFHIRGS